MTLSRESLRVILADWCCSCGDPPAVYRALLRLLRMHDTCGSFTDGQWTPGKSVDLHAFAEWIPDEGVRYWMLYRIDACGFTEHGSNILFGWLTEKGAAVREALAREEIDEFEALSQPCCVHGYDLDIPSDHDCMIGEE